MATFVYMKKCRECKIEKEETFFGKYKNRNKVYYRNICKSCRSNIESKKYRESSIISTRAKISSRRIALKNLYGITENDYDKMFLKQNGKCAICKKESDKKFNIDHCHEIGKVRGLLCWSCNMAIGYFKDNINSLNNAIKYLKNYGK